MHIVAPKVFQEGFRSSQSWKNLFKNQQIQTPAGHINVQWELLNCCICSPSLGSYYKVPVSYNGLNCYFLKYYIVHVRPVFSDSATYVFTKQLAIEFPDTKLQTKQAISTFKLDGLL